MQEHARHILLNAEGTTVKELWMLEQEGFTDGAIVGWRPSVCICPHKPARPAKWTLIITCKPIGDNHLWQVMHVEGLGVAH